MERTGIRKYTIHITAVVAVLALAVVSTMLWLERRNRFPVLEAGAYAGKITGIFSDDGDSPVYLFAKQMQSEDAMLLAVLHSGYEPHLVEGVEHEHNGKYTLPVTVEGEAGTLRFTGRSDGDKRYSGTVTDVKKGTEGEWQLVAVSPGEKTPPESLRLWLKLREELDNTEHQIAAMQDKVPQQKAEVEKLSAIITEGVKLKSTADEKYAAVQKDLEAAQAELKQKQERAKDLEQRLQLALRVTAGGRLVTLARESLERDGRWLDSMLRAANDTSSPEVDAAVALGEKVLALREQIDAERAKIDRLSGGGIQP